MYNQIIQYIMECAMKHVAVKSVKYQSRILINQQNSNPNYQVVIEDDAYLQYNKTGNVNTMSLNIDILSHCGDDDNILDIQSTALQIAAELLKYVETDDYFLSLLKIDDYDFLMLSHFTDDDSAGIRITIQFVVPNPVDMCSFRDNFDEDKGFTVEKEDNSIDLKKEQDCENGEKNGITLNPIKLPHK